MYNRLLTFWMPLVAAFFLFTSAAHAEVIIDWVTVGDPGNAADNRGHGAVAYTYRISKYEVTNAQYTEFLNAVAATDTYGLYNESNVSGLGGITRSGSSGSYTYSTIAGREDMPVNWVSFWDALRFANWLHNGQPPGAQDSTTTEDGAYTFSGATGVGSRNPEGTIFLTSEDEWYKAAYYNAVSTSYFWYPTGSNAETGCVVPSGDTGNSGNCHNVVRSPTDVGAYSLSGSPYGTFDQGGNVWEWNEAIIGSDRGLRGAAFNDHPMEIHRSVYWRLAAPSWERADVGFRVGPCEHCSVTASTHYLV